MNIGHKYTSVHIVYEQYVYVNGSLNLLDCCLVPNE